MIQAGNKRISREEDPASTDPWKGLIGIVKIFLDIRDVRGYPPRLLSGGPASWG
jgi:hypothetical protein